jgi:hypothetical protein
MLKVVKLKIHKFRQLYPYKSILKKKMMRIVLPSREFQILEIVITPCHNGCSLTKCKTTKVEFRQFISMTHSNIKSGSKFCMIKFAKNFADRVFNRRQIKLS